MEPSDIAVGHYGTEDLLKEQQLPPSRAEDGETFDEWGTGSVPVDPPPKGPADTSPLWLKLVWAIGGLLLLIVIAAFLFFNGSGDTNAVSVPDQTVASAVDSGPEPTAAPESVEEEATDPEPVEEPAGSSGQATDPAGDNGGEGSGADILGLEYVGDGVPRVLLTMKNSPLKSSLGWYSYYLEVTFKRASGATSVVIWENHAGTSRSGALDSSGNADGEGVSLADDIAELQTHVDPDDPVVKICVKAFSLVNEGDAVTRDEMEFEVGSG